MHFNKFFILFSIVSIVGFALYPEVDLETAALFYREGEGFYLKDMPFFHLLYKGLGPLLIITILSMLGYLFYQKKVAKEARYFNKKAVGFLLAFLLIGPGLMTNLFFKEFSGRARPVQVEAFGGQKHFTPYYQFTNQCDHNCSFISGHAAAAFFFMAFGYVLRSRKIFFLGLGFGVLMALTRVAQGGHFLSDVTFAFILNFIVLKVLYYLFYKEDTDFEK
jgi:lipid A 4'-phosphatase